MKIVIKKSDINKALYNIIEYIIAFCMIIFHGCIWTGQGGSFLYKNGNEVRFVFYLLLAMWAMFFSISNLKRITRSQVWFCLLAIACVLFTFVNSLANWKSAILGFILPVVCGLLVSVMVSNEKFANLSDKYVRIMAVLAAISLFFWFFASVLKIAHPTGKSNFWWGTTLHTANSYWGIYYEPDWMRQSLFGLTTYRNCGIYAEAPMYAFSLCIAYGFAGLKPIYYKRVKLLLLITVFTTSSVTGMVFVILFETINMVSRKASSRIELIIKGIAYIIIASILIYIMYDLINEKIMSRSGSVRSDHFLACLKVFLETFPLGAGVGNKDAITRVMQYKQGMSVGLPQVYAQVGLGGVLITCVPLFYSLGNGLKTHNWRKVAFIICFCFSWMATAVSFISPIPWIMTCYLMRKEAFEFTWRE